MGPLALASWDDLLAHPEIAEPYTHLVALDPPAVRDDGRALRAAPGAGFAHLAWGHAESEFALAVARRTLAPRDDLIALYRALRGAAPCAGERLAATLREGGRHPRTARECARLVRILEEIGVIELDTAADTQVDEPPLPLEEYNDDVIVAHVYNFQNVAAAPSQSPAAMPDTAVESTGATTLPLVLLPIAAVLAGAGALVLNRVRVRR
jgi:hypothetical protein